MSHDSVLHVSIQGHRGDTEVGEIIRPFVRLEKSYRYRYLVCVNRGAMFTIRLFRSFWKLINTPSAPNLPALFSIRPKHASPETKSAVVDNRRNINVLKARS